MHIVTRFNPCYDGFAFLTFIFLLVIFFMIGFNPCYDGFAFLTWIFLRFIMLRSKFQSLLWWICLFDLTYQFCLIYGTKVSILVMMDLPFWLDCISYRLLLDVVSILVMMDLPFWLPILRLLHRRNWCVSILVMMDLPFWPSNSKRAIIFNHVSILVMMDLPFWRLVSKYNKMKIMKFQSLLWWICLFDQEVQ